MKKILMFVVLVAFLFSTLSVAFAEEGKGKYGKYERKMRDTSQQKLQALTCPADTKVCPDGTVVERSAKRNCEFNPCPKMEKDDDDEDEDDDSRQKGKDMAREKMRDKIKEHLEKAKERKKGISDAAKELKEKCRAKQTLEGNCGVAFEKIKEHLNKVVDRMIEALSALKNRVTPVPPADVAATTTTPINDWLSRLQTLKTEITAAKTRDELKAVMKKVSATWAEFKQFFNKQKNDLHFGRARSLLAKAERVHEVLDALLEKLQQQGGSDERIKAIETALKAVDAQVEEVKQAIAEQDKDVVKNSLKKLHGLLKDVIHRFRQAGKGNLLSALKVKEAPVAPIAVGTTETEEEDSL